MKVFPTFSLTSDVTGYVRDGTVSIHTDRTDIMNLMKAMLGRACQTELKT